MTSAELLAAAQSLEAEVKELDQTVKKQTVAIDRVDNRTQKSTRRIRLIAAALAITVCVVALNAWLIREVRSTQADTLSTQQQTNRVLCPLYGVFLASDTPEAYEDLPPEQVEFRKEAFRVIREGMADLGCS